MQPDDIPTTDPIEDRVGQLGDALEGVTVELGSLPGDTNEIVVGVATKVGVWGAALAGIGTILTGATAAATSHAQVLGVPPDMLLKVSIAFGALTMVGRYGQAIAQAIARVFRRS